MITLHQLRCFLATYSLGSLTAAAAELGYAQPSVSEQVRLLEKSLNTQLFQRVGRGVVPTEAALDLGVATAFVREAERVSAPCLSFPHQEPKKLFLLSPLRKSESEPTC